MLLYVVQTFETFVYFNETTRRYIPEGCHLHICRYEDLESHMLTNILIVVGSVNCLPHC
jgi:hypothetical protein